MAIALITGAAGGIGRECVKLLATHSDIQVLAVSRSASGLERLKKSIQSKHQVHIETLVADFSNSNFEKEIANHVLLKGGVNYLINNAGLLINKPFEKMSEIEVEAQMRINYTAPFMLVQKLLPLLVKAQGIAHVVNIGSMGGYMGSSKFPGLSAYSASKSALATLTECLAAEYDAETVKFNCLALGSANTEMLKKAFPDYTSPTSAVQMAQFIVDFTLKGHLHFNGKVLPVAGTST